MVANNQSPFDHPSLAAVAAAGEVTGTTAAGGLVSGEGTTPAVTVGGTTALCSAVDRFNTVSIGVFFVSFFCSVSRQQRTHGSEIPRLLT